MKNEPSPFRKDPLPVNPNATPEARALLARLHALRGKTVLSAQHDYISSGTRYNDEVAGLVGRVPAPALLADQPLWSWIMPWGGLLFRFNSRGSIRALYAVLDRP